MPARKSSITKSAINKKKKKDERASIGSNEVGGKTVMQPLGLKWPKKPKDLIPKTPSLPKLPKVPKEIPGIPKIPKKPGDLFPGVPGGGLIPGEPHPELDDLQRKFRKGLERLGDEILKYTGSLPQRIEKAKRDAIRYVGGEYAEAIFSDIERITKLDPRDAEIAFNAIVNFIKTGDLNALNPFVVIIAAQIKKARDDYWGSGHEIPFEVQSKMPDEIRSQYKTSRWIDMGRVKSQLSIPTFAINHLNRASALCAIDLIFFKHVPPPSGDQALHLWAHELYHTYQYDKLGLNGFVQRYLGNEFGFRGKGAKGNEMEADADRFACKHFRIDHPAYIGTCPT